MELPPVVKTFVSEFLANSDLLTPARIWHPKYTLQYKCKCGKRVSIVSKTKRLGVGGFLDMKAKEFLYADNKCPRNSYLNPCHHKFVKTITKFEPRTRIDTQKGIIEVSKKIGTLLNFSLIAKLNS